MKIKSLLRCGMLLALLGLTGCWWLQPPVATLSVFPLASAVHTIVNVVGQEFGETQGNGAVSFNGVAAVVETWGDTAIAVRVPILPTPTGARDATIEVSRGGTPIGTAAFTVLRGILFETFRDGNLEIYVMNPDGTQPMNLTDDPGSDSGAAWSPDGTQIAFVSRRDDDSEIYTMNADGSDPTNLTRRSGSDYFPVWSPNGTQIAYMSDRGSGIVLDAEPKIHPASNLEVFVMDADGTDKINVSDHWAWDGNPSWSPDGDRLVFETTRDSGNGVLLIELEPLLGEEIYVVDADGTSPTRISNHPADDAYPTWSPVDGRIVFQSDRDGDWEIYTMNPDGSGQTRLTHNPASDSFPTWAPGGDWITFHSQRDGNTEIYRISPLGTGLTRLTSDSEWDWGPSWSPDGSHIVFQSWRDGNSEIYRMNADGSGQTRLTVDSDFDFHPSWTPYPWLPPV